MQRPRIALYSHDAMGIGHMRRNLLIADALRRPPTRASSLLIAGAGELNALRLPPGVDCLTLPAFRKSQNGTYRARGLRLHRQELVRIRAAMIQAALAAYDPDVLIVDKHPRGLMDELEPALRFLTARKRTRIVLGMRDVLDEPSAVQREWTAAASEEAIRHFYEAIWVYGDPAIYDVTAEYGFTPDVAAKLRYTGYLDPRRRIELEGRSAAISSLNLPPGRLVLCTVGGGQDGGRLVEAFARTELPPDAHGLILTGPFLPADSRRRLLRHMTRNDRVRVLDFTPQPFSLLEMCDRVITMGGYNTLSEIVALRKVALCVPRVSPRREQLIRASHFRDRGLLDVLLPDRLTPEALAGWLADPPPRPAPATADRIDFGGLERLPEFLTDLLSRPTRRGLRLLRSDGRKVWRNMRAESNGRRSERLAQQL